MIGKQSGSKRQVLAKALSIVLLMALGAAVGYLVARGLARRGDVGGSDPIGDIVWIVVLVLLMAVAYFVQVIAHEAGHLVCGLATGYRFRSFRVGSIMLVDRDSRLQLKRFSLKGTGGQCLLDPPDLVDGRFPYKLYNLGGALANALLAVVGLAAALALPSGPAKMFFGCLVLFGLITALTNGIPLTIGGVNNDGKNLLAASEGPDALRALWIILKTGEKQAENVRVKDMPADWFAPASPERLRNPLIASVAVLACGRLLDEGRIADAERAMRDLLERDTGMLGLHRQLLHIDLAFCELMGQNRPEEVARLLDNDTRRLMKAMKSFPSVLRTRHAEALLTRHDEQAAQKVRAEFERMAATYPYPSELAGEWELMDAAEDRFRQAA